MNNNESIFCIATPQIIAVAHIPTQLASHWEYNIYQLVKNKNINTDIKIFIHPSIQPINHILIQHENQEWGKSTKISAIEHINKEEITKYRYYIYSKNHQGIKVKYNKNYPSNKSDKLIKVLDHHVIELNKKMGTGILVFSDPITWMKETIPQIPSPNFEYWSKI